MTTPNPSQMAVPVIQSDREAVANLVVPHGRWPGFPADFLSGRADSNELTQAFASYRLRLAGQDRGEGKEPALGELAALSTQPPPMSDVRDKVRRLIIAAREVAYSDPTPETIRELDKAAEAFASDVPWDDEPVAATPDPREIITAGLRAWVNSTPDIDLSSKMMRDAADFIMGQPGSQAFAAYRVQIEQSSRGREGGEPIPADPDEARGWRANASGISKGERLRGAAAVNRAAWERGYEARREWVRAGKPASLTQPPLAPVGDVRSSKDVEGDIRIAIWNAGKNGGMGDDLTLAFIRRAMEEPCMQRALAALQSSPSSYVAEGTLSAIMRQADAVASGPNGSGGMKVTINFPKHGPEYDLQAMLADMMERGSD